MTPFAVQLPGRILFGRSEAARAPGLIHAFGGRGLLVHGRSAARADWLRTALTAEGAEVLTLPCPGEPTLAEVTAATDAARAFRPDWVAAIGGGSVIDLGKAVAALAPASGPVLDYLEIVGTGRKLERPPLPFIALPTTAGTGAEATRNAVIGVPEAGRKVSLRDDRMLPRLAIIDPALTDACPRDVTLASGLDALAQVIEPYVSNRATPFTDALTRPAIARGLAALGRLMQAEDPAARDEMAFVSLCGGIALANAGLGAVHGLAGPAGGLSHAGHDAICGALLGPVLALNRRLATGTGRARLDEVCGMIGEALGCGVEDAPETLRRWVAGHGLPDLAAQGLTAAMIEPVAEAALTSSSMRGNPVALTRADCIHLLQEASRPPQPPHKPG